MPLFGVLLADWLVTGEDIFDAPALRYGQLIAWLVGFGLYQWLSPVGPAWWTRLVDHTHPAFVTFTASLPSLAAAFALAACARSILGARDRAARQSVA